MRLEGRSVLSDHPCFRSSACIVSPVVITNLFPCADKPHDASFAGRHSHSLDILPLLLTASVPGEESIWKLTIDTAGWISSLTLKKNRLVTDKLFFNPQTTYYFYTFSALCMPTWSANHLIVWNSHPANASSFSVTVKRVWYLPTEINNNYYA